MDIRPIEPRDRPWVRDVVAAHFGSARVVSRGVLHEVDTLPGLIAMRAGRPVGLVQYQVRGEGCEVVVLVATEPGRGVGTRLLESAREYAAGAGCRRVWLVTTNDNAEAIHFYERRGGTRAAVHTGAVAASRKLKPEIPTIGHGGVPITDEIEFEWHLDARR
jgi:ribosomal protein S18 acetylase RimI-like enzyme